MARNDEQPMDTHCDTCGQPSQDTERWIRDAEGAWHHARCWPTRLHQLSEELRRQVAADLDHAIREADQAP